MNERQVRPAAPTDADWMVDLSGRVQRALTAAGSQQQIGPLPLEVVKQAIHAGHAYIFEKTDRRIGSVLVDPVENNLLMLVQWDLHELPGPLWYLHSLMLEPEEQGKGLGLSFLAGLKHLVIPTSGTIILNCWAGNAKLRDFYRRAGFTFHSIQPVEDYEVAIFFLSSHAGPITSSTIDNGQEKR